MRPPQPGHPRWSAERRPADPPTGADRRHAGAGRRWGRRGRGALRPAGRRPGRTRAGPRRAGPLPAPDPADRVRPRGVGRGARHRGGPGPPGRDHHDGREPAFPEAPRYDRTRSSRRGSAAPDRCARSGPPGAASPPAVPAGHRGAYRRAGWPDVRCRVRRRAAGVGLRSPVRWARSRTGWRRRPRRGRSAGRVRRCRSSARTGPARRRGGDRWAAPGPRPGRLGARRHPGPRRRSAPPRRGDPGRHAARGPPDPGGVRR
ncbi:hypothetical protein GA0074696_4319 [Micromonospora purpureochromogenes]|uniref:Uncharacterized protein n=1 Tax=Micromonospora purpureochromogenes TaxID=47872 RepID=A0A1C4ZDT3_9ACTN|nr:hypothetical protein GA0074696_4319 [Micromonospora purpureochromogenes]